MTALYIIGGILLFFILIGCIPVGATAEYSAEGYWVAIKAGPISVRILPKKPKPEKSGKEKPKKDKKDRKKQHKAKKEDQQPKEADSDQEEQPKKEFLGGKLPMFKELIGLALELQSALRKKLIIKELTLHLTIAGGGWDPAKSAILYGRAWAGIGNLWTVLERVFIIRKQDVWADIDFLTTENRVYAKATATITIGAVFKLAVYYGVRGLKIYLRHRKRNKTKKHKQKGGNQNVTSSE